MGKPLDRLFRPRSAAPSSPADSIAAKNPANAINECQPEEVPTSISLRILTWNIWFETLYKEQRATALIETIKSLDPLPDVCCFQECTARFELHLQENDWWRKTWAMTKCADQSAVTHHIYGTMVFVRRELIERLGFKVKSWFEPFEVSQNGRGLLVLELTPPKSKHPVWTRAPCWCM
jgi:endonuclease/exonuclease/phosphatase family metal-dependent hydrolase